jgi:hypothetical protein
MHEEATRPLPKPGAMTRSIPFPLLSSQSTNSAPEKCFLALVQLEKSDITVYMPYIELIPNMLRSDDKPVVIHLFFTCKYSSCCVIVVFKLVPIDIRVTRAWMSKVIAYICSVAMKHDAGDLYWPTKAVVSAPGAPGARILVTILL